MYVLFITHASFFVFIHFEKAKICIRTYRTIKAKIDYYHFSHFYAITIQSPNFHSTLRLSSPLFLLHWIAMLQDTIAAILIIGVIWLIVKIAFGMY